PTPGGRTPPHPESSPPLPSPRPVRERSRRQTPRRPFRRPPSAAGPPPSPPGRQTTDPARRNGAPPGPIPGDGERRRGTGFPSARRRIHFLLASTAAEPPPGPKGPPHRPFSPSVPPSSLVLLIIAGKDNRSPRRPALVGRLDKADDLQCFPQIQGRRARTEHRHHLFQQTRVIGFAAPGNIGKRRSLPAVNQHSEGGIALPVSPERPDPTVRPLAYHHILPGMGNGPHPDASGPERGVHHLHTVYA